MNEKKGQQQTNQRVENWWSEKIIKFRINERKTHSAIASRDSITRFEGRSVGRLVTQYYCFGVFEQFLQHRPCLSAWIIFFYSAPVIPHTTWVAVYPALLFFFVFFHFYCRQFSPIFWQNPAKIKSQYWLNQLFMQTGRGKWKNDNKSLSTLRSVPAWIGRSWRVQSVCPTCPCKAMVWETKIKWRKKIPLELTNNRPIDL